MTSFLKFLKRHIGLIIFLIIMIILIICSLLLIRSMLDSGNEGTIYGNRLNGIEKVTISDDILNKMVEDIKQYENVKKATNRIEGKILNVSIDVLNDTPIDSAKKLVDAIVGSLNENELAFYDIQVIITCSENAENNVYPIAGYKHRTSSDFAW